MIHAALVLLFSIVLHEIAHVSAAIDCGDHTSAKRLTLNPFVHIDPFLTLALPALAYALSGVLVGSAKPIRVHWDAMNRKSRLVVASAGIVVNAALAIVGWLSGWVTLFQINVALIVFNLLPVPPLDGWRIWRALWAKSYV